MGAISCLQTGGPNEMITNLGVGLEAQQDMGGGAPGGELQHLLWNLSQGCFRVLAPSGVKAWGLQRPES